MSTLSDLLGEHTTLPGSAVSHLQRLVAEWQLLSDLSFSDLGMWVRVDEGRFLCVAHVRPTTGKTAWVDDLVSRVVSAKNYPLASLARSEQRITNQSDVLLPSGIRVDRAVIPVRHDGEMIAVINRDSVNAQGRHSSQLESSYIEVAEDLFQMVTDGSFPSPKQPAEILTGPRAGDGMLKLDPSGVVSYVSPNALSAYHRLGFTDSVTGAQLASVTRKLISDPFDGAELAARICAAVQGRPTLRMEIEAAGTTVLFRSLPLRPSNRGAGALVLVRDVTEVRRRDRALLSKDATIREIHHRVKNNLQTVAALLRLQARRSDQPAVQRALRQSTRRVATIAMIHETLSTSADDRVDLDQIVDRLVPMISDVAAAETAVQVRRIGSFGVLNTELATPLVMVLAEVVQNAVQHAYPPDHPVGLVTITVARSAKSLDIVIDDDGDGMPEGFSLEKATGLGLQIVRTLVDAELRGSISMRRREAGLGTEVTINVPLRSRG